MTDDQKMAKRLEIVAEARTWLGTPYRHQGAVKGRAVDCVNMVNEVLIACGVHARRPQVEAESGAREQRGAERHDAG